MMTRSITGTCAGYPAYPAEKFIPVESLRRHWKDTGTRRPAGVKKTMKRLHTRKSRRYSRMFLTREVHEILEYQGEYA